MSGAVHLARRFVGSLRPGGPAAADAAWAESHLLPGEVALFRRMSGPDRRHAVGVARRTAEALGGQASRAVVAAALLHDVGKIASGLGTYGRVVATLAGRLTGGRLAAVWSDGSGISRRVGLYLRHAPLGAELLEVAGSDPLTVAWAREHHLPPEQWTLDRRTGAALKAADDD